MNRRFAALLLCEIFISSATIAQNADTYVLLNKKNMEPVPFATIKRLHTKDGTFTNEAGRFTLPTSVNDTLLISSVGFISQKIIVRKINVDTIFLQPHVRQLSEVIVHNRKRLRKYILGIPYHKTGHPWGLTHKGQQFAQLIKLPVNGHNIFRITRVILYGEYNVINPVLLHLYSRNEKTGLPDEELLQKQYLLNKKNVQRKKAVIDLDQEGIFIADPAVFISVEAQAKPSGKITNHGLHARIPVTRRLNDTLTYMRHLELSEYYWSPLIHAYHNEPYGPVNTMFSMEVEEYR